MDQSCIRDIWKGSYFLDNGHYNSIRVKFNEELKKDLSHAKQVYGGCQNNSERIKCFKKYFSWEPIPDKLFERFHKSSEISTLLRETGNKAYKVQDISNAFRGYNLALVFAPNETEQMALAYANRSALFIFINESEYALNDVKAAMKYNKFNEQMCKKLNERQAKCQNMMLSKKSKDKGYKYHSRENEGQKYCEQHFYKLKLKNKYLTCGEDSIQVVYSPECGRRLIAAKDIPAGTSVLVENPFCTVLEKALSWDTEHCSYCTKPILGGIPCPDCIFGLYCNEDCLKKASLKYHNVEHGFLPYFHSTEALHDSDFLLALRILIKVGPSRLLNYFQSDTFFFSPSNCSNGKGNAQNQNPSKENGTKEKIAGFDDNGIYDSKSYESVYNLVPHRTPLDFYYLESLVAEMNCQMPLEFKSILITHILEETTDFFKVAESSSELKEDFKDFISSLLLQHFENLPYNILSLSEWYAPTLGPISHPFWIEKAKYHGKNPITSGNAVGVFPLCALCNHSCDPNAIFVKHSKINKAAIVTSRRIPAGQEICISYKAPFTRMNYEDRIKYLKENYKFNCNCYACLNKFSMDSTVKSPKEKEPSGKNWETIVATSSVKVEEAEEFVRKEQFTEALQILVEESDFLSHNFEHNYFLFQVCQELLRRCVVHMIHL